MAILGIQADPDFGGYTIPTEVGVTAFGIFAGVGGALGQILAGRQLSQVPDDRIPLRRVLLATGIGVLATAGGALLLPSG